MTNDGTTPRAIPPPGASVAELLRRAVPAGPRDDELMDLEALARCLVLTCAGADLPPVVAQRLVLKALLGDDEWAARAPSRLAVYVRYSTGPSLLDSTPREWDGSRFPSARELALREPGLGLVAGHRLSDINPNNGQPAPRFLAVAKRDAWEAFEVPQAVTSAAPALAAATASLVKRSRPVGAPVPGMPEPIDLARELADEKARDPHGAVKRLAEKYGCHRATVQRLVKVAEQLKKLPTAGRSWPDLSAGRKR